MIRVALVIPTLDRSGAEKQLTLLATHLPREEFDLHVIALTRGGPYEVQLQSAGVPVTVLGKRWKLDPFAWWRLRQTLRRLRPDVVHTWLFAANAYGRLASSRSAQPEGRPRLVVSERCVDTWKRGWQLRLDRRLITRTDRLVGNSRPVAEFYEALGYPPERVQVIPNAVAPPPAPALSRARLLAELAIPPDAKLVAYNGRLAKQKRVDDLLWATQVLRQADPRTYFLVVGDGPERDRLIHRARQVEAESHVRFLGHRDDAASLLHNVDAFWLASDFEGQSNSLMEAMAAGCPVVATSIPPNRELVSHGVQGFLVDVGDSAGFAQFTRKLFDDPELAARLGNAGRERMARDFSVDRMTAAYATLYRRLCGAREPSGTPAASSPEARLRAASD